MQFLKYLLFRFHLIPNNLLLLTVSSIFLLKISAVLYHQKKFFLFSIFQSPCIKYQYFFHLTRLLQETLKIIFSSAFISISSPCLNLHIISIFFKIQSIESIIKIITHKTAVLVCNIIPIKFYILRQNFFLF